MKMIASLFYYIIRKLVIKLQPAFDETDDVEYDIDENDTIIVKRKFINDTHKYRPR